MHPERSRPNRRLTLLRKLPLGISAYRPRHSGLILADLHSLWLGRAPRCRDRAMPQFGLLSVPSPILNDAAGTMRHGTPASRTHSAISPELNAANLDVLRRGLPEFGY